VCNVPVRQDRSTASPTRAGLSENEKRERT
jgi:hypothetical protein